MKKIISLLIVLVLFFSMSGCRESENTASEYIQSESEKTERKYITLLYSASDTFNPYDAKTDINRQLCRLLYESLVKLDNEFNAVYSIAESVKTTKKTCTVKIKDTVFSDGSKLTADDVVYSYKLAKKSLTAYGEKLYNVDSLKAEDDNTVVFKLKSHDPYFVNVLDFPIIKAGSEDIADSDSVKFPPIGSGRYKVNKQRDALLQNENYHGKKGSITEIRLINAPDSESVSHYVEIGAADMYYSDLSDGKIFRMSGEKIDINLNNLVYIGVNHSNKDLSSDVLRQAIASALDREKLCKDAYYNNALPAIGFFSPVWKEVKSLQNIQTTSNSQITIENLEKIGYNGLDKDGFRRKKGSVLRFSMLVNKENRIRVAAAKLIAEQLKAYGIGITVVELSYEKYLERLQNGDFQLYLGEVKITENMDISNLVTEDGSAAYGIKANKKDKQETDGEKAEVLSCSDIVMGFYKGDNTIGDVVSALQTDMPFIPVCYRKGVLFCNDNIENVNNSSASDIYFSIESYKVNMN